jgi:hypothetical protein
MFGFLRRRRKGTRKLGSGGPQSALQPVIDSAEKTAVTADSLDQIRIDQLHAATLRASDSCFEMKKLCATLVVATGTLVSVFTNKTLTTGAFAAGLAVVAAFWLADSVGFFYQRRLRWLMDGLIDRLAKRSSLEYEFSRAKKVKWFGAAFNGSMMFYLLLALLIGAPWAAFESHLFGLDFTTKP